jgi:hypothetical protein
MTSLFRALAGRLRAPAAMPPVTRIVVPADWQVVGLRPLVQIETGAAGPLTLGFVPLAAFQAEGAGAAALASVPVPAGAVAWAHPDEALRAGRYVAVVTGPPGPLAAVGLMADGVQQARLEQLSVWRTPGLAAPPVGEVPLFTLLPAAATPELLADLLGQDRPDFEILVSRSFAAPADPRIRVRNAAFPAAQARGRYIVPLPEGTSLPPDALDRLARHLAAARWPSLLTTEGVVVDADGNAVEYLWRGAWSRLAALATDPIGPLAAVARDHAAGACNPADLWELALRLETPPVHVAEILALVRAGALRAQPGPAVLNRALARAGLADRFTLARPGASSPHHLVRAPTPAPAIAVDVVVRPGDGAQARETLAALGARHPPPRGVLPEGHAWDGPGTPVRYASEAALLDLLCAEIPGTSAKLIIDSSLALRDAQALDDIAGTLELDPATGIVGGLILGPDGTVQHLGYLAGLGGFVAVPGHRLAPEAVPLHLPGFRRQVDAVHGGLIAVRAGVFATLGKLRGVDSGDGIFGVEFCLRAASHGIATAFAPGLVARSQSFLPAVPGIGTDLLVELALAHAAALHTRRFTSPHLSPHVEGFATIGERSPPEAQALTRLGRLVPPATALNVTTDPALADRPHLNVLLPGLAMRTLSGGPNTALILACQLAAQGVPVRFIATDAPPDPDPAPLRQHALAISGIDGQAADITFVDGTDRSAPLVLGEGDLFMATAWWTAQMVKWALPQMQIRRFFYLIQDFEPGLQPYSSHYALALETYGLDCIPIVNHPILLACFAEHRVGRFADPAFAKAALAFSPAIDRRHFHPEPKPAGRVRTLLFYARPRTALRNLYGIGVAALHQAVARGAFPTARWRLLGMGERFDPEPLGPSQSLLPLPWRDFETYAAQMRQADVLLSLMLAPHPSYPPLEMAACGNLVVTNSFDVKTQARLSALSPNLIAALPTVESIADALVAAWQRAESETGATDRLDAPASWDESFRAVIPALLDHWRSLTAPPSQESE